ncbi:MAG: nicotinate phosphoribosyltransferase, partial [Ureaplasma sp.]|nr:nicotinate phosphoribosyltransferase [Ureaplasma sp.]
FKTIRTINSKKIRFDKKIKKLFYTTSYFIKTRKILISKKNNLDCTMQFIHFSEYAIMSGFQEIVKLLKFTLTKKQLNSIEVFLANDNQIIDKNTPLMIIKGKYSIFGWLENIIDGILANRCSVATNTRDLINSLLPHQKIIYMCDRTNNYFSQSYDAYPAYLNGIDLFVTNAQIELFNDDKNVKVIGTIPHALIHQYHNDLVRMINDYKEIYPNTDLYCLIDFENDVIKTLEQIKGVMHFIKGVRIDTSNNLIDKSLEKEKLYGINHKLIDIVRTWLNKNKFFDKKIIVTSNINPNKINEINKQTNAVDFFGVGGYFNYQSIHVSADLVKYNNENYAKFGRHYLKNTKNLTKINFS